MNAVRSTLVQASAILALAGLAAAGSYYWHPSRPALYLSQETLVNEEGEISLQEAMAAEKSPPGVLWIDARVRKLYTKAHVPDALLLCEHESDFEDQKVEVFKALQENLERLVIVYCDGKKCEASKKIAEVIRSFHPDPQRVKVLHGGWDAWVIR